VLNALVLVNYDTKGKGGTLSEHANHALDHMWACQQEKGSWRWLDFGLRPWETGDEYYSAALAAVATGMAGTAYHKSGQVQEKIEKLRQYVGGGFAGQSLHSRILTLWASTGLQGLLSVEDKEKLLKEISEIQNGDGGWKLSDLGPAGPERVKWKAQGE